MEECADLLGKVNEVKMFRTWTETLDEAAPWKVKEWYEFLFAAGMGYSY